jgi:hypothetical protein
MAEDKAWPGQGPVPPWDPHPKPVNAALTIDQMETHIGEVLETYKSGGITKEEAARGIRVFCAEQVS